MCYTCQVLNPPALPLTQLLPCRSEKQQVAAFFESSGPGALRWYYQVHDLCMCLDQRSAAGANLPAFLPQVPEERTKDGSYVQKGTKQSLFLSTPQVTSLLHVCLSPAMLHTFCSPWAPPLCCPPPLLLTQLDKLSGKCVYFVRTNPKGISEKTYENDMAVGEITGTALDTFKALVSDLYLPLFQEQQSWGKMPQDHTKEFLSGAGKFSSVLSEASNCLQGGIELRMPEDKYQQQYDLRPGSFTAAAADVDASKNMEDCLNDWCRQVEALLAQQNGINPGEEPGPDTELEFWRTRMAQFNSLTEQLKTKECKLVLGVTHMGKTMVSGVVRGFACSCCLHRLS